MSKERPILFSAPMVRAILEGRKTQTRRIVKPQPVSNGYAFEAATSEIRCHCDYLPPDCLVQPPHYDHPFLDQPERMCPYGEPGDRLWVRETFVVQASCDGDEPPYDDGRPLKRYDTASERDWSQPHYRATDPAPELWCDRHDGGPCCHWKPAIHMPRWASRITLRVTSIRVERLQAIADADARAEGIDPATVDTHRPYRFGFSPRESFAALWDSINGERASWSSNPWIWRIEFEVER